MGPYSDRAREIARLHCQSKHPEQWLFVNPFTKGPFRRWRLAEVWNEYSGLPVKHYREHHTFKREREGNDISERKVSISKENVVGRVGFEPTTS